MRLSSIGRMPALDSPSHFLANSSIRYICCWSIRNSALYGVLGYDDTLCVYVLGTDDIRVLAVAHQSRRPGYWRGR
jgi:hypothetical protein